ncbi:MAG: GrpB family protein [Burkholderiales bacterium]|nr:GrpB family protein [Burkholderiales bacterium]
MASPRSPPAPFDESPGLTVIAQRRRLLRLFSGALRASQHIGSTAVARLPAKPTIDLLGGIASMSAADSLIKPLLQSRYTTPRQFNATRSDRRWLMPWADRHRTHHPQLVVHDRPTWHTHLRLRDALRIDAVLTRRDAPLK